MRLFLAIVLGLLGLSGAMAQDLPDAVADAYVAYGEAADAGDYEAATSYAYTAWQEGETANIDPETLSILAANYGEVALLTGEAANAARAYERAAEIADRNRLGGLSEATNLRLAAQAYYAAGEYRQMRRRAESAVDILQGLPDGQEKTVGLYYAHMMQAYSYMAEGRLSIAGRFAARALDALEQIGAVPNNDSATLAFLSGVNAAFRRDHEDSAYYFTISSYLNDQLQTGMESIELAQAWAEYSRGLLDVSDRADLLRRLQNSGYRPADCAVDSYSCYERPSWMAQFGPDDNVVDASPIRRVPPEYPSEALMAGAEGLALFRFTVSATGEPTDIEVVFSVPYDGFGEQGAEALRRWRYNPATVNGRPVDRPGVVTQFEYALRD